MRDIDELKSALNDRKPEDQLNQLSRIFQGRILFTTSFGIEDQVITHYIFSNNIPVRVVTLDTGRLFPETYKVFNETLKKYNKRIEVFFPSSEDIQTMVTAKGPFSFYYSKEDRLACCRYRKLIPLDRALEGMECWISGIRSEQSGNRSRMDQVEYDGSKNLFKVYPLFNWTYGEVMSYIKDNGIPYNVLHDKGYVSIGCEPCTRAVREGEDFRSGRWWWESGSERECGLHLEQVKSKK